MNTLGRTIGALAVVHALAAVTSTNAAPVQITSGFMTVSEANPAGEWMLAGKNLSAGGQFDTLPIELPSAFLSTPMPLGTSVGMSWFSDSIDGWTGQMLFDGVAYNLAGNVVNNSFWELTANNIFVGHAGSYVEPLRSSGHSVAF